MKYIILSEKVWNAELMQSLQELYTDDVWECINDKADFTLHHLSIFRPDKIFIPHWSHIIPQKIFNNYECIVFHMTDLPYGRGGSPLQNLISRGQIDTKISALRVVQEVDAGPIYCKYPLSLLGSAEEIFIRANRAIKEMIVDIIHNNLISKRQEGEPVIFNRRKPADSNLASVVEIEKIYDHIRMLDADGYPKAFVDQGKIRYEFSRASLKADGSIYADVRIYVKK